ncbi:MAG: NCS2 family permease [Bacillota bacterium]
MALLEKLFKLSQNGTDVKTEVIAGVTTFMTMAYIIFVNPSILSKAGMDFGAVMTATVLSAAFTTLLNGLFANIPFALASGMGLNAFFAFVVAKQVGWQAALGCVFIEGIAFLVLALTGVLSAADAAVPASLKRAVSVGIGLFIALIGMRSAGLVVGHPETLITMGDFAKPGPALSLIGLVITAALMALRVRGAILLGILITTVIGIPMGVTKVAGSIVGKPASLAPVFMKMDIAGALSAGLMTIFAFGFVDIFDTMGTLVGTAARAGLLDEKGRYPKTKPAMIVDAIGTILGAVLGTSTVTTYVESSAGIAEGGRTGLTSVVVALLFLLSLVFSPLAGMIPAEATAPALVIVGVLMMGAVVKINFEDFTEAFPAFMTIAVMPFTGSIASGIAAGFVTYPLVKLFAGRAREVHWAVWVLGVLSFLHFVPSLAKALGL